MMNSTVFSSRREDRKRQTVCSLPVSAQSSDRSLQHKGDNFDFLLVLLCTFGK